MSDVHLDPEPMHGWFGLSYANYLVVQRALLESMPVAWQRKLIALLEELESAKAAACIESPDFEVNPVEWVDEYDDEEGFQRVSRPAVDPVPHYRHAPNVFKTSEATHRAPRDLASTVSSGGSRLLPAEAPEEPDPSGPSEHKAWCRTLCGTHAQGIPCGLHGDHECTCRPVFHGIHPTCWCARCDEATPAPDPAVDAWGLGRMNLCQTCGNKRCPKATFHGNECTGSNESGQEGSDYR